MKYRYAVHKFIPVRKCQQNIRQCHRIKSFYQIYPKYSKNLCEKSKFRASQHSLKSKTSDEILNLANTCITRVNENIAIDNSKFKNLSKKFELIMPFKN